MDRITKSLEKHYSKSFSKYGATPKGVDWSKLQDVEIRYRQMLNVIALDKGRELKEEISILDVGCGYGGLIDYANKNGIRLSYTGVDVAKNMVEYATTSFPEHSFIHQSVFDISNKKYDYVVCNGILTQKLDASIIETDRFATKLIHKMFGLCRFGIAFNTMKTKVNFTVPNLYYRSPVELLAICMNEISDNFIIDHAYPLYEYTIYLYKN